ncbi:MAG TPA: hypothetical protein VGA37_16175 [Gemmatimonadales bacterium]
MPNHLAIAMPPQPTDSACGPSCLHAVYHYYGDPITLDEVMEEVEPLSGGGTLAVLLGCHALRRGYHATIYTYNLHLFDPTWFNRPDVDLAERLRLQAAARPDPKVQAATKAYLEFMALGGRIKFEELTPELIRGYLQRRRPVLTGLSATYLYGSARETGATRLVEDDIAGTPTGHFVVIYGYDPDKGEIQVADPLGDNPRYGAHHYAVNVHRLLSAILLGIVSFDANLLVLEPTGSAPTPAG